MFLFLYVRNNEKTVLEVCPRNPPLSPFFKVGFTGYSLLKTTGLISFLPLKGLLLLCAQTYKGDFRRILRTGGISPCPDFSSTPSEEPVFVRDAAESGATRQSAWKWFQVWGLPQGCPKGRQCHSLMPLSGISLRETKDSRPKDPDLVGTWNTPRRGPSDGNNREECFLLFFLDSHSQLHTCTLLDKNFSSIFKS